MSYGYVDSICEHCGHADVECTCCIDCDRPDADCVCENRLRCSCDIPITACICRGSS